jgi:polysaccharide biosynthesis protein PslH
MSSVAPSILYVTSFYPNGPASGAQHRVLNIGRLLQRVGKVSLVVICSDEMELRNIENTHCEFEIRHIARSRINQLKGIGDRVRFELSPSFLNCQFTDVRESDREEMLRMINEYDVIWVHSIRTANEYQIYRWPHTVLDVDDVQSRLYMSYAKRNKNIIRSILDYRLSLIWARREHLFMDRFNIVTACSENDRRYLGSGSRIIVIRNGFNLPPQEPQYTPTVPYRLGFIGPLGFMPNRSGVEWFVKRVWSKIKCDVPEARLRLIGRGSDNEFPNMGPDIDGLGFLDDPNEEIATWSAMIVPIRVGAGTRIKIAEAFSRKCPVVSTTLGAFGYGVEDGEEILLADNAEEFRAACVRLMTDRNLAIVLSERAWKRFKHEWTWDSIGESVANAVKSCLNRR